MSVSVCLSLSVSVSLSHTHTHTHILLIYAFLVMGWYTEKKTTDQHVVEKRWVFSFDLKEENKDECPTERKRVPHHRSDVLKGSPSPGSFCPFEEHGRSEYPRLGEESEKESRDETTRGGTEQLYQSPRGSR